MEDNRRILRGEEPLTDSKNAVKDMPENFNKWVKDNQERIESAKSLPYFIRDNKERIDEILKESALKDACEYVAKWADAVKIDYLQVQKLSRPLTEQQIIDRLGGEDRTKGSCSSLAFAYAANKGGLEVLDFRGGESCDCFSRASTIKRITNAVGGKAVAHTNDFKKAHELLKSVEEGKEYYFTCGRHAAIVRKNGTNYEYLEMQSTNDIKEIYHNGWHILTDYMLKWRFKAQKSHTLLGLKLEPTDVIVEIGNLYRDNGFKRLMGYINTLSDKQMKGKGGRIK